LALLAACTPVDQASVRTVAAVEITVRSAADRADLLNILRSVAATDASLHVDDMTARWRDFASKSKGLPSQVDGTFYVGVWRGKDDDEMEVDATDMGHKGRVWLTFPRGLQPERSSRLRSRLLAAIYDRWPDAQAVPVLPSGGLPLSEDLRRTAAGYKIAKSAAARYELPASSAIIASD
jgi:hypothetical protein